MEETGLLAALARRCRLPAALFAALAALAGLAACSPEAPVEQPRYSTATTQQDKRTHYVFAVHPLHNPQLLQQKFEPLMRYLGEKIPDAAFDLDASNNYADYEEKLRQRQPHFSLPNPYHAVLARDWGYHVLAKMGNDDVFRGIFIVRKDSPVKVPADLRGKVVAYPAPTALAAAMMPQLYLQKQGIDVETELNNQYVGTHNSSIMNAYLGQSAASATWPVAWEGFRKANPKEAEELKVIWQTPQLIQNAVIVREDVPPALRDRVRELLTHLQDSEEGRAILASIDTSRFDASDDQQFEVVRRFLDEFNRLVKKKTQ